MYVA